MQRRHITGLDVLRSRGFDVLRGKRVGLVTHPAAVATVDDASAAEIFADSSDVQLEVLFGPEHGFAGVAQDLEGVASNRDPITGIPVISLYGETFASLKPSPDALRGLDVLVIDLQDVGSRYYTFQATMLYCMEAAAEVGLPVVVLDRPNPLYGEDIEGPTVQAGFESFVGVHPIPIRHGMTIGELALLYRAERVPELDLTVIPCETLRRWRGDPSSGNWEQWINPSPNMPNQSTAFVYPGMCLFEGTNISEGRGTTRPFEYIGFPGIDVLKLEAEMIRQQKPKPIPLGADFRPAFFKPMFQKHAGKTCGGVFTIPDLSFRPVRAGLLLLVAFRNVLSDAFQWRTETYEFVSHIPAIDLLFGSDRERLAIEAGVPWQEIAAAWEPEEAAFRERRKPYLLYK